MRREAGSQYPRDLRRAFDRAYADEDCEAGERFSCSAYMLDSSGETGTLESAELIDARFYIQDEATGPGLRALRADDDMDGFAPAHLICEYDDD